MSSDYNIYELLDLLSKDNLQATINSSDAAEKLSLSMSSMLKEIDEDSSIVPSFLSKGILCLIKFFQQFFPQLSATCECSPKIFASFEDIFEILNLKLLFILLKLGESSFHQLWCIVTLLLQSSLSLCLIREGVVSYCMALSIADTGIQTKCTVVLQFGEDLISYITNQFLPFHFRLKIVKYTNLLFERCPTYVKDCLYAKPSYKKNLKNALKLISSIGDYEFQVGIIECVFRAISKQKRVEALNALCPPEILSSILAVKDENFEADCRRVLNTFNSQQGAHQRVFSIPCLEVTLGNLQLQKPKDDNYKEFWIDFNTSSKRISFYCSQIIDNEDPQETDEDIWETICILKDYVQEISSNEDDEVLAVQFKFLPLSIELIPGFTLEKFSFIKILFKDKDAVMKAIQEIFCNQKCSVAKNQICIKEKEKSFSFQPKKLLPSVDVEQEDVDINAALSMASSQQSVSRSMRKSSVPSEIMSSHHSTDGRHCEVGAIRICRQFPSPEALNRACNPKKPGSTQMSRFKVNNEIAKQKQERKYKKPPQNHDKKEQKKEHVSSPSMIIAGQPHNQLKAAKNKNSDLTNLEELKMFKISRNRKCQAFQIRKQAHSDSESSINIREQTVHVYNSVEEGVDEAIPPTFETKSPSKDSIQSKKLTSPSIHASKTSSYKQNKTQSTTKNSDNTYSNITTRVKSNQTKSRKLSPVAKKQSETVEENRKKKGENKSPQNQKITLQEKEEKCFDKTQFEKVAMDARPNDLKKLPEDLVPSPNHNISSNNGYSITDKESLSVPREQRSFVSHSVSTKKNNSDGNISSKINNSETNTTSSRKGRRLRSFDTLDLLPQNYPLPKDVKPSTETPKKISSSKKKNPRTLNITTKHLEEDKVISIKETQPESAKADEVTLIPDSLPQQNDIDNPEEDQPKHKLTGPAKLSAKKKLAVDSGISSSNNSPACVNDLPSTTLKKRSYSYPPQQNQRNLSPTKQTISQSSFGKKTLPKTNSFNDGKINNETGKALKTLDLKQHKDNNQDPRNKSILKEKEESCYDFPSHEASPPKTSSQVSCYIPITQDNLSKFNKGQKTLAKELDERIEEFVKTSCQNIPEASNASPFAVSTADKHNKIQSVSFKKNSKQTAQDSTCDKTNGNKNDQHFAENDPLPSKSSQEAHPKSPSVVTNMEEEQLKDESHSAFSMKDKIPSEQNSNNNEVLYQAITLGSVSALSKDPTLFITKSKQVEVYQEQPGNLAFSPVEKDQVSASSRKHQLLTNRNKNLNSAKPSMGGKENKNPGKIFSSPTEKLFKVSPAKRRNLSLPLKRDQAAAKVFEKKKGYDPYDFDSGSSIGENFQPAATCPRFSMASLSTPTKKKQNPIHCQNTVHSAPQLQTPKGKKKLQAKHPKAAPENNCKFEKESKKNSAQNVRTSPICIHDSDCDSPEPKKRSKAKMMKSKVTANTTLPPLNLPQINSARSSVRKRKDINYKEMSSSSISSFSEPVYEHKQKKKKNTPVNQNQNFLHNNTVINLFDQEDQMKDAAESTGGNTSHTQQSEISWINPQKSNSKKIHVEKTYAIKKQTSYYGHYACIPKRRHNDSPKGKTRRKTKKPKDLFTQELSPHDTSHKASLELNGKTDHGSSPTSFDANSPQRPKNIYSLSHDKASHKFSLSSDWQMNNKTKQKRKCIQEPFLSDSIEIQRADSFVMFPEDSRLNISISKTESTLQKSSSHPLSSFSNKSNFSDLEITFSSTEDPKLLLPTPGADSSIPSLNDEPIISNESKLMLTPSPYLTLDDLEDTSDRPNQDTNDLSKAQLGQTQANASFKGTSLEDISHSTPVKEHDIELPLPLCAGGDYKSKTGFRKSLFSDPMSDNSDESKKSSFPSPIVENTFLFHERSLKKLEYSAKVNFSSSPLSISDKSANMSSSDDSSSDSSHEESSRNDIRSYDFPLHSDKSSHHQTAPSITYKDDNIKNIVESFTEDMKKSIQTKQYEMSAVVEEVLKGTQKALNKICEKDVNKRSDVHLGFDQKIQQVMNELEASTTVYEEKKKKVLNYFQEQINDLQKLKDVQQKSLCKLKMINSLYHQTVSSEGNSSKAQHQVQNIMKSQMHRLQSKLLDQARQQEMQQVRNQLRKMLL